jgi:hypothetical protein
MRNIQLYISVTLVLYNYNFIGKKQLFHGFTEQFRKNFYKGTFPQEKWVLQAFSDHALGLNLGPPTTIFLIARLKAVMGTTLGPLPYRLQFAFFSHFSLRMAPFKSKTLFRWSHQCPHRRTHKPRPGPGSPG